MKRYFLGTAVALLLSMPAGSNERTITQPGVGQLETHMLESAVFGNTRPIRVWLPPGYSEKQEAGYRYPVLYMNDGQDLFDADSSVYFDSAWQVDESLPALIEAGEIEPVIVVGIDHAGRRGRPKEYLPYPDEYLSPPEPSPMGHRYADFLAEEVIPFIEQRYAVRNDRSGRALGGASYGGLITLYVAMTRPELFSRLLLESPSFYVDDDRVLRELRESEFTSDRVYVGVGTNEIGAENCSDHETNAHAVQGVTDLAAILSELGMPENEVKVFIEACAVHSPAAWGGRFPEAMRFLFGP